MITSKPDNINLKDDRSIGDLLSQLATDTGALIRQDLKLVVTETRQNLSTGADSLKWLVIGAAVVFVSTLVLVGSLILLLGLWLPLWVSAALVGIALCVPGLPMLSHGWSSLKKAEIAPEDSIASIKENTEWLKKQIKN